MDLVCCPVPKELAFLQGMLNSKYPSMLMVYVVAILAHHDTAGGTFLGSHKLISAFLKEAIWFYLSCSPRSLAWDLHLLLKSLKSSLWTHSGCWSKMCIIENSLSAGNQLSKKGGRITCLRWSCMFCPDDSRLTFWPDPGFMPKVMSLMFVNQVNEHATL